MDTIKKTRDELIEALINDDYNTVQSGEADDYLYNLLKSGFKGYDKHSDKELLREYQERMGYE